MSYELHKKKKIRIKKAKLFSTFLICLMLFASVSLYLLYLDREEKNRIKFEKEEKINAKPSYENYFFDNVKTLKDKKLYQLKDNEIKEIGTLASDLELSLQKDDFLEDGYFQIKDTTYYIDYKDIEKSEPVSKVEDISYKNYIPFNESVKTLAKTSFYQDKKLIFTINEGMNLPIIIKDDDYYGVLFEEKLYYLKKEDGEVIESNNTSLKHTEGIATLVYHFVYDVNNSDEMKTCKSWNTEICLSSTTFKEHMSYLKEEGFYTATMEDLSLYIDGKVQLPEKTVIITIDDGYFTSASTKILEELNMHATLFLIGIAGDPKNYTSSSLEIHSHTYDLHYTGACSGGQGSPLKCLDREKLLSDLKKSRDTLNGTTVFCYPFFEYNDYAISVLKEAGFEMAFAGNRRKIRVGDNKFTLPRYGIVSTTTVSDIKEIVN